MASINGIIINRNASIDALDLGVARDDLRKAGNEIVETFARMQHFTDGSNFATLEQQYGLPTGAGSWVYSAMQQVSFLFSNPDPNIDSIINRMQ